MNYLKKVLESQKPGVLCICRIIFDEKYAIDTEFVPAGILSPVSPVSWPCPRWPLASLGFSWLLLATSHVTACNPAKTELAWVAISLFSILDLRCLPLSMLSTSLLSCEDHCDSAAQGRIHNLKRFATFLFIVLSRGTKHEPTSVAIVSQMKYKTELKYPKKKTCKSDNV